MAMVRHWRAALGLALLLAAAAGLAPAQAQAQAPEVWLAPMDNVTHHGEDYPSMFADQAPWGGVSGRIAVFGMPIHHLLRMPPEQAIAQLQWLRRHNIRLSLELPVLPVDKHQCGHGIEGMVWPGETRGAMQKLRALGAEPDYFGFDLPLTAAHLSKKPGACHLPVAEVAARLAQGIREIREFYPHTRLTDEEVPTGIPHQEWMALLSEWLTQVQQASGEQFYAMVMDVWWPSDWHERVRQSAQLLRSRGIRAGVFIDAVGHDDMPAGQWVADARRNFCDLRRERAPVDFVVVANWMDSQVHNLPDRAPDSLTGLAGWILSGAPCGAGY